MEIKEKTCELGVIRYRMPNVPELMALAGRMGFSYQRERIVKFYGESELVWLSKVMENMGHLIVSVDLEKDGKHIQTYAEALNQRECYVPIRDIAGEYFIEVSSALGWSKKKPSPTEGTVKPKKKAKVKATKKAKSKTRSVRQKASRA